MNQTESVKRESCGCLVEKAGGLTVAFCNEHDVLTDARKEISEAFKGLEVFNAAVRSAFRQ